MTTNSAAANHLAELDARYEAHRGALREHVEHAKAALAQSIVVVADRLPRPTGVTPPPPATDAAFDDTSGALIADTPLLATDDDGIPLWEDPVTSQ